MGFALIEIKYNTLFHCLSKGAGLRSNGVLRIKGLFKGGGRGCFNLLGLNNKISQPAETEHDS